MTTTVSPSIVGLGRDELLVVAGDGEVLEGLLPLGHAGRAACLNLMRILLPSTVIES